MLLLIDNLDSFTYNIVDAFLHLGKKVVIRRSHFTTVEECEKLNPSYLVIGPGPKNPKKAGISKDCILHFAGKIPILGICLGHQAIGEVFGGKIIRAIRPIHGQKEYLIHSGSGLFRNMPRILIMTRYHSLVIERKTLPKCLEITAETKEKEIMGIKHTSLSIEGVQFHPESILSESGLSLLQNFLS